MYMAVHTRPQQSTPNGSQLGSQRALASLVLQRRCLPRRPTWRGMSDWAAIAVLQRGRRWYQPWLLRCDALGQSAVIQRTIRSDMNGPLREMFGRSIL
jgi:hypothetical protein